MDMAIVFGCWVSAYFLRYYVYTALPPIQIPAFSAHLVVLIFIFPLYWLAFKQAGLYKPQRTARIRSELLNIARASNFCLFAIIFFVYFFRSRYQYSRSIFIYFWVLSTASFILYHLILRKLLRYLRKKGYNLRHILIVGTGSLAEEAQRKIGEHPEFGLKIEGFLSRSPADTGRSINGVKIMGTYNELKDIVKDKDIDQVIFVLSAGEDRFIRPLLGYIKDETVDIKIIPDLGDFFTLRKNLEDIGGLSVITLRESPLGGWARITKRTFDIIGASLGIVIFSPLMFLIAILIKLTSKGPVFYRQKRLSLDGIPFELIKFRTMVETAEDSFSPGWTNESDKRRTWIGKMLRRFSLDELPQFLNILKGEMSIVGPRPERRFFVEQFSKRVPKYTLRHMTKSGITGWAQIHGWRGNTAIDKRIEYDLYYIENWSIWLDIKIVLLTILAIIKGKGAY